MNSPSVLVLDDDTAICRIVSQMLSLESYQVRTSQSIEEAVAAIKGKPFDAYILDHRLREGSGLDVAERLARPEDERGCPARQRPFVPDGPGAQPGQ